MKLPVVVSIPHGGRIVPDELRDRWALSEPDALHDGDPFVDRIYDFSDRVRHQLTMRLYRAAVDLNRAPDDTAPKNPDGVIKSRTCYDVPVYAGDVLPNAELTRTLLERYYHPYHRALAAHAAEPGIKLAVDCHSMAAVAPPVAPDRSVRPLFCIGNLGDAEGAVARRGFVSCPTDAARFFRDELERAFANEDVEVRPPAIATLNVPFAGGFITTQLANAGVPSLQIEMSRALYLTAPYFDEASLTLDDARVRDLNAKVWRCLERLVAYL